MKEKTILQEAEDRQQAQFREKKVALVTRILDEIANGERYVKSYSDKIKENKDKIKEIEKMDLLTFNSKY